MAMMIFFVAQLRPSENSEKYLCLLINYFKKKKKNVFDLKGSKLKKMLKVPVKMYNMQTIIYKHHCDEKKNIKNIFSNKGN